MDSSGSQPSNETNFNLTSSSPDEVVLGGTMQIRDTGASSRSSSARSVRRQQSKGRASSAMARMPRPTGNQRGGSAASSSQADGNVYQQFHQQAIYVSQSPNPEVVRQAANEVMSSRAQAEQIRQQAIEEVMQTKAQTEQLRQEAVEALHQKDAQAEQLRQQAVEALHQKDAAQSQLRNEATQAISQTERQALQTIMYERSEAQRRETALREEVAALKTALTKAETAHAVETQTRVTHGTDCSEVEAKLTLLMDKMVGFQESLNSLETRVVELENWNAEPVEEINAYEEEEELVPGTNQGAPPTITFEQSQPRISSPVRSNPVRTIPLTFQTGDDDENRSLDDPQNPEDHLRWKDVSSVRMPALPDSAGSFRSWRNAFLPMLMALDSSPENFLYVWLLGAFNAKTTLEIQALKQDSEGFPRFDRILCSWFTKDLKGHFGARIQSYIEECIATNSTLRGRPLLNMVVREFDLDAALGGVVSSVELFQLTSPESDLASLVHFRDKVRYILGQLPIQDRPQESLMSKWLYERLKRIRSLQLVIDRIKESPVGSNERTFDYLWSRLERIIAESQHEKNLTSIQEGLKKGPKKIGAPAAAPAKGKKGKDEAKGSKGKGGKSEEKGKGKGGGKGQGKKGGGKSKDSGGKNQGSENKGACLFWPRGLCRRGSECPYRHEGPSGSTLGTSATAKASSTTPAAAKAASPPSAPAAKVKAAVALCSVIGAAGVVDPQATRDNRFAVEWALDSGAGEDLSSFGAFTNQGVPMAWLQEYTTITSNPLTFETGGGAKAADTTIGFEGDKAGEGIVYMLKNCPYVRSLGKLIQRGYGFFWSSDYEPTLVPPDVPFQVSCDVSQCHVADRVDHCVPIFKENVSFRYGMPAAPSVAATPSLPAYDADSGVVELEREVIPDAIEAFMHDDGMMVHSLYEAPKESVPSGSKDPEPKGSPEPVPAESPKGEESISKVPIDHLLTHIPAHPGCDVCREAKLRAKARKRFANQGSSLREARVAEAPTRFLEKICID